MISPQRIFAVVRKEWLEIIRDRIFFVLAFVVAAFLMLLLGYGLNFDVEDLPFGIVDHDKTKLSRDFSYQFIASRYFDFKGYRSSEKAFEPLIASGKLRAYLVIPEHFQRRLLGSKPVKVLALIDGTYPFRANLMRGYFQAIASRFSTEYLVRFVAQRYGMTRDQARKALAPVAFETRYMYNQSVNSDWSVAAKLIMAILLMTPPFLTALGVVREKESGSIYNIYASTVTRFEFLVGKLSLYVVISLLNACVLYAMARILFLSPFKGNLLFFSLVTLLYVICTTGIGLVISVFARTQISAMVVAAIVTIVPAALYSGCIIPIASLSKGAQVMAHLMPAMYYNNIVLGCFLKGSGAAEMWPDVLVLGGYAVCLLGTGYALFTKRPKV
ncbi:MAG: ABC transporter permease [Desulfoplanes sp.]|nr:ABC transporter permease [Desulfoplanes sp.]MDD4650264.1 ABC transporter permease [Desulfoplanes sp.]